MIEINLIPDVKQELIKAQQVRSGVVSLAIIIGLISVGLVVLLGLYVFVGQFARGVFVDKDIKDQSSQLAKVEDLDNTLTVQNQLTKLSDLHDNKKIDSRIFDVLSTIIPPAPNDVSINKLSLDSTNSTITIDAQTINGFPALEVFKKTIAATKFQYDTGTDPTAISIPLASNVSDSNRSFGQDAGGQKILRFTVSFTYPTELFSRLSKNATIIAPTRKNVTDSFVGIPQSLFVDRATDVEGGGE